MEENGKCWYEDMYGERRPCKKPSYIKWPDSACYFGTPEFEYGDFSEGFVGLPFFEMPPIVNPFALPYGVPCPVF